ncbi:MAG: hypothetical protein LBC94_01735 [Desulfovibrio sp.]|jgi:hypothetical protein|nr:hypothetical protein [Desulfovibrio sp.]
MSDKQTYSRILLLLAHLCVLAACSMPFRHAPPSRQAPPPPKPPAGPCVVLSLPLSGTYEPIAAKISKGAELARQEAAVRGVPLRLEIINAEGPRWLAELAALPQECVVVGGPLQAGRYDEARKAGLTGQRVFFTFLPSLESGDEGVRAWRFFPSPQDQIDALIAFATDTLNIHTYGAFYPDDAFGGRMTALLEQSLASRGMYLQKASYPPAGVTLWSEAAAALLRPVMGPDGRTPVPQTTFETLFLPDSWKNMDMLTTSLLYNGEDRLVLLGTTLWEQSLSNRILANAERYILAVFPGAWNPVSSPAALKTQGGDFWMGLGYDFTRFAVRLGLVSHPAPGEVNARARAVQMPWSMAPLTWDGNGVARQKLWIFQVSSMGMTPVSAELFAQNRAVVLQRAALRMQGQPAVDEQGNPLAPLSGTFPQDVSSPAGQPGMTPVDSTPRPSYKLTLPPVR